MHLIKVLTSLAFALAFLIIAAVVQAAPAASDEIQGTAKDVLGRPLSGVSLVLKTPDETIVGKTKSDVYGHFVFSGITPGNYAVVGEKTGFEASTAIVTKEAGSIATTTLTLTAQEAQELSVVAERLTQARNSLSPKTGGSEYSIDKGDIAVLPEGENTSFNQVLLQAPGVANDSYGQLHIRGDHANVQYRINGVILPEGITLAGQSLDTRFVSRVDLLTGALPAQYGDREAGVIEIETKTNYEPGGNVDFFGGSHDTVQPGFEYGSSTGKLSYFVTYSYLQDNLGVENPTSKPNAIHDNTEQDKGFAYASYLLNSTTKLSVMLSSYDGWIQIPNNPALSANPQYLAETGVTSFNPSNLNENQYESNRFAVVSLQSSIGSAFDYQISFVSRYSSLHFTPDPIGDLVINGVAANIFRSSFANSLQGDSSYRLNDAHTIRAGFFGSYEDIKSNDSSTVFPVDANGNVTGEPLTISESNPKNGNTLGALYLQDEWKPIDKLTVNYGLRYDEVNAFVSASQLSPRLGLVYKATPETTLHAAYARYFTPPATELVQTKTLNLFANTTSTYGLSTLNSPVLPERSNYFDAGVSQKVTHALTVGLDGFYKITKDLIDEGQFWPALVYTPFNYAQGYIYGVELTGNYKLGNFGAYANFARTVSMAKDVVSAQWNFTPAELDYIANNWIHVDHDQTYTASAGVSYNLSGTVLTSDATFGSGLRQGDVNQYKLLNNFQLNLGAIRKFQLPGLGNMEGRLVVINVTDNKNEIRSGTGIGVFSPQYGPRIGFFAGLTKFF